MDNMQAFALGEMNRGEEQMVFDWDKAVKIIKERNLKNCGAGLKSDFKWTAGMILIDGKPYTEDYTYLASTWAIPQLIVYSETSNGPFEYEYTIDCWVKASETNYNANTPFPKHLMKEFE